MTTTLDYVIIGHSTDDEQHHTEFELLAFSEGVPSQDITLYRKLVELDPLPIDDERKSQAIAMVSYDTDTAIFARTHYQQGNSDLPVYQYIFIPYEVLTGIGGRIAPLLTLVETPIPLYKTYHIETSPLILPPIATGNLNTRLTPIQDLLTDVLDGDFELAMTLIGAILHERQLVIRNFPMNLNARIDFIQGLRMLLPAGAAMRMSFTTYCDGVTDFTPMIAFLDDIEESERWVMDWLNPRVIPAVLDHPYIETLQSIWKGNLEEFINEIRPMDILSLSYVKDDHLSQNLITLTERFKIDQQVRHKEVVETEAMIDALDGDISPQGRLRYQYIEKLLENALNNRDSVAGKRVAQELNRDSNLERALSSRFDEMLETQPDTVYVFIRNRLNNFGVDERWLPRLQLAASNSLDIAIGEGDVATLASWLELIAREPYAYELETVLKQGILAAQPRAHEDGELGIRLILISARRIPEILDNLFQDSDLMTALPDNVGMALRQKDRESLEALLEGEPEYFLLALSHALQTSEEQIVTVRIVQKLWSLYISEDKISLPTLYQAHALLRLMGTQNSHQMTDNAIDMLLGYIIESQDNELFLDIANHLNNKGILFPRLTNILQTHDQTIDQLLTWMNWVADIDNVSQKDIINTYFELLDHLGWDATTQPMIESLARLLNQNTSVTVSSRYFVKLFDACTDLKLESPSRVAMKRVLSNLTDNDDVTFVVEEVVRIFKRISWNKSLLTTFNAWWRDYTHSGSLVFLQRLDRELETQRGLETQKQILQTVIAMRRLLGNQGLTEFASAVQTTYSLLESIADAFDKPSLVEIDPATIRNEIDRYSGDITLEEQHILSKNLRELAQYVIQMADNRSKSSLMRSDEAIDRQLSHGNVAPQGSIDFLKWISGYLGGTHTADDDE